MVAERTCVCGCGETWLVWVEGESDLTERDVLLDRELAPVPAPAYPAYPATPALAPLAV